MCILLKFDYAKFGVSNLCFSEVIEEKPLGARLDPPLVQKGLRTFAVLYVYSASCLKDV